MINLESYNLINTFASNKNLYFMGSYKRAKKEDSKKTERKVKYVVLGKNHDGFEKLKTMCNDKSNELINSKEIKDMLNYGEELTVVFWTKDYFSELICISKIVKTDSGLLSYTLDFSQSTL